MVGAAGLCAGDDLSAQREVRGALPPAPTRGTRGGPGPMGAIVGQGIAIRWRANGVIEMTSRRGDAIPGAGL